MRSKLSTMVFLFFLISGPVIAEGMESGKTGSCEPESVAAEQVKAAPGAPSGLKLVLVPSGVRLVWTLSPQDPGIVTGYEIVRATVFSGPYVTVGTVEKGVREFTDTSPSPEHIYYYKVRAVAGDIYSPFSNEVAGEIPGKPDK